jgi:hypothetical protein
MSLTGLFKELLRINSVEIFTARLTLRTSPPDNVSADSASLFARFCDFSIKWQAVATARETARSNTERDASERSPDLVSAAFSFDTEFYG